MSSTRKLGLVALRRLLILAGLVIAGVVLSWALSPTDARAEVAPYLAALGVSALVLGLTERAPGWSTAGGTLVVAVCGLLLLNLCQQPARLPLLDALRSAYWPIPLPMALYRNTPLLLFAAGGLLALAGVPQRRRSPAAVRVLGGLGCLVAFSGLLFPGAVMVHALEDADGPMDPSAVPVMVDGELSSMRWTRSHDVGRPLLLATGDKLASDRALAQVTHGLQVSTSGPSATLSVLWSAQRALNVALVVGRVAALPGFLVIALSALVGSNRGASVLRVARVGLAALLAGPSLFNLLVVAVCAVAGLTAGPSVWVGALLWQLGFLALVLGAWLSGDVLARASGAS